MASGTMLTSLTLILQLDGVLFEALGWVIKYLIEVKGQSMRAQERASCLHSSTRQLFRGL